MLMLHFSKVSGYILWICIALFFFPDIFFLIAIIALEKFFYIYMRNLSSFIALVIAIIFYNKYFDQDNDENNRGYLDPGSLGLIN